MADFTDLALRQYALSGPLAYRGRFVHNWFSNFDACGQPVSYRGHQSPRLEIPFVAAKNPDAMVVAPCGGEMPFITRVFACASPSEAKRLGAPRKRGGIIDPRPDWDGVNIAAMDLFLRQRWQPGTRDAHRLAGMTGPIVEWNNWRDDRWGVTIGNCRGRNALGLLLDKIADEIRTGYVAPGAEEPFWAERQEELIVALNAMRPETLIERPRVQQPSML